MSDTERSIKISWFFHFHHHHRHHHHHHTSSFPLLDQFLHLQDERVKSRNLELFPFQHSTIPWFCISKTGFDQFKKCHITHPILKSFYLQSEGNRKIYPTQKLECLFPFAPILIPMDGSEIYQYVRRGYENLTFAYIICSQFLNFSSQSNP